ncbi:hypothetical protein [Silvibacterium acidisoli]|uniref:hypothetical protein n=1 Tax=Acidobacteriaceae bacterium ZG23-2 TaxID=2883246 RepID=UPI00406C17EF
MLRKNLLDAASPSRRALEIFVVVLVTLATRLWSLSGPYYVDASRHIQAIESGRLVIHTPGYFAFNLSGFLLSHLFGITAARALQCLNISFSILGTLTFYLLAVKLKIKSAFALSLVYALSPIVWFAAAIHSTYAAMTFLVPLLLLCLEGEVHFLLGCLAWGVLTAFRPSDGVFLLPWIIFKSRSVPVRKRLLGAVICVVSVAAWWTPTALRYRLGWLGPLHTSLSQLLILAQGFLVGGSPGHAMLNAARFVLALIVSLGLLLPLAVKGLFGYRRSSLTKSLAYCVTPGLLFFSLVFVSDAAYLAFLVAPFMLLAAAELELRSTIVRRSVVCMAGITFCLFMLFARQIRQPSTADAVLNAYILRYTVPSVKAHSGARLAEALGRCDDRDVKGICGGIQR